MFFSRNFFCDLDFRRKAHHQPLEMDSSLRAQIHGIVRRLYQHPSKLFPTQQPRSFDRASFVNIFQDCDSYVVSQKANGLHMTLVFANLPKLGNFCCMMDRSENIFIHEVVAPADFFLGTLITGELQDDVFYAFDAVSYCGRSLLFEFYEKRMECSNRISEFFDGEILRFSGKPLFYRTKKTYGMRDFLANFRSISNDDGLIFMPIDKPLTKTLPFKWKEKHTVDLMVRFRRLESSPRFAHQIVQPLGIGNVSLEQTENCILLSTFDDLAGPDLSIVDFCVVLECLISPGMCVVPVKFRHDKKSANLAATVLGTMRSVAENISRSEIVDMFLSISSQ